MNTDDETEQVLPETEPDANRNDPPRPPKTRIGAGEQGDDGYKRKPSLIDRQMKELQSWRTQLGSEVMLRPKLLKRVLVQIEHVLTAAHEQLRADLVTELNSLKVAFETKIAQAIDEETCDERADIKRGAAKKLLESLREIWLSMPEVPKMLYVRISVSPDATIKLTDVYGSGPDTPPTAFEVEAAEMTIEKATGHPSVVALASLISEDFGIVFPLGTSIIKNDDMM